MENAENYARAIRAALAYTGQTRAELAQRMGMHEDTLGRKLKRPGTFTVSELIDADRAVKFERFMEGKR